MASTLSYFARLPAVVLASSADLVVEDFAPPFTSLGVGRWSRKPTVANVQWNFARETAQRYGLLPSPFVAIQRWGTRGHDHLIAPSADVAIQLSDVAPRASISIVDLGVDDAAFDQPPAPVPGRIGFLGRLEAQQKGLDLLADAMVKVGAAPGAHVILAGDGRDREVLHTIFAKVQNVPVAFIGRLEERERWDFLRSCQLIVMPSRWETYGLVALEAFACGVPVVAFDIPALRSTIIAGGGSVVPAFNVQEYAATVRRLLEEPIRCAHLGASGRRYASTYRWQETAAQHEAIYLHVASA